MSIVAGAGLVVRRRDKKWTYYSLPNDPEGAAAQVIGLVMSSAADDPVVFGDLSRIPRLRCPQERGRG